MANAEPPRNAGIVNNSLVPLHELLVRMQQGLARAVESAHEAVKSEVSFSVGERPMYLIEGIDFDLAAGINGGPNRSLQLDFETPSESRSRLKFRVVRKPMEIARGRQLVVSNLDPLALERPKLRLRVLYFENVDGQERVLPNKNIVLKFTESGEVAESARIELTTDSEGRAEVAIDLTGRTYEVVKRAPTSGNLELTCHGECYIWAEEPAAQCNVTDGTEPSVPECEPKNDNVTTPLRSKVLILPIHSYVTKEGNRR